MPDAATTTPVSPPQPHRVHCLGLLYTSRIEKAGRLAAELEEWLTRLDVQTFSRPAERPTDAAFLQTVSSADLLLTLGGDGTALRGARIAAPLGIPLVCVGLGRLSFMAELTPDDVLRELPTFLAGDYWLEERAMLEGSVRRDGEELTHCLALNEVVLGRERHALTLHVAVRVDGGPLTHYLGDAVIVSTATGSTAYALSVGGPVLAPESRQMILVPVAAHLNLLPPLVLPPESVVELEVLREGGAGVNCDGLSLCDLRCGDVVQVQGSSTLCYFARIQERGYFFRTLQERLYRRDDLPAGLGSL